MSNKQGTLFIISGSAGSGKGTVIGEIFKQSNKFCYSVSATTRDPRPGEVDGVNYFFVQREQFELLIEKGEMLEYAEYCNNLYGTPKSYVLSQIEKGMNVILEIEVCGAMQIKEKYPDATMIFITPPSFNVLRKRLIDRATESKDVVEKRLEVALREIKAAREYDYIIINRDHEAAIAAADIIAISEGKYKKTTDTHFVNKFIADFTK